MGVLNNRQKNPLFSIDERVSMISELTENLDNVKVESFEGLLVDFAKAKDAQVIIRGLRAISDFENEIQLAQSNKVQYPELETLFMTTSLQYSYLSSTVAKEFASYGGDISLFVPEQVIPLIEAKFKNKEK